MNELQYITQQRLRYDLNTLRPRQYGRHFADYICNCTFIFRNENCGILILIPPKYGPINNTTTLVQIVVWDRRGATPLFEPTLAFFTELSMRHSVAIN